MSAQKNSEHIKKKATDLEFSLCGVADIREIRKEFHLDLEFVSRFDRAIVLGKRLLDSVMENIRDRPTPLYFHHYRQLNFFLDRAAYLMSSSIQEQNYRALPIPASQIIDWERHVGHVSHRHVGQLAGLGWLGRNNLLVNPELGSRYRLVTVLTDMPLEVNQPQLRDCGDCRACISVCPAGAIKEKREDFDHIACYEKLKEFRRQGLVGQHICGVCVRTCKGPK
jgi:epoxyqueuosine reductase